MTSPLSIGFSTMWTARAPYSSGRAEARGVRDLRAERRAGLLREARQQRRVEQARARSCTRGCRADARSRAAGSVMPTIAALGRRVGDLADLPVVGGDRGGVDDHAALAALVGLVGEHRRGGQPQHVERADQVDRDHLLERLERVRPALARGLLGPADAGAADGDPQRPRRRRPPPATCVGVGDVAGDEAPRRARPPAPRPVSALRSAIVTSRAGRAQAPRGGRAEPGGAARDERARSLDPHGRGPYKRVAQEQLAAGAQHPDRPRAQRPRGSPSPSTIRIASGSPVICGAIVRNSSSTSPAAEQRASSASGRPRTAARRSRGRAGRRAPRPGSGPRSRTTSTGAAVSGTSPSASAAV